MRHTRASQKYIQEVIHSLCQFGTHFTEDCRFLLLVKLLLHPCCLPISPCQFYYLVEHESVIQPWAAAFMYFGNKQFKQANICEATALAVWNSYHVEAAQTSFHMVTILQEDTFQVKALPSIDWSASPDHCSYVVIKSHVIVMKGP